MVADINYGPGTPGDNELHRAALAANGLARTYAEVVQDLLQRLQLSPMDIAAVGAHGQTVRHQPGLHDGTGYTLQINNPALLAELTRIVVVADFRSRDVAAMRLVKRRGEPGERVYWLAPAAADLPAAVFATSAGALPR